MVAGASGIDLVLLVIDGSQGPQPQTWEHLAIVEQLRVPRGIPVISKADLADPEWALREGGSSITMNPSHHCPDLAHLLDAGVRGNVFLHEYIRVVPGKREEYVEHYVDNYLDGGYHVAHLHKGLASALDLAGYHTEYSSMSFAMFFLAEYINMVTVSAVAADLFLGGWHGPFLPVSLGWVWFLLKVSAILFFYVWMRWTLPRYRYDQLMAFGWKVLLPLATLNLVVTAIVERGGQLVVLGSGDAVLEAL